MSRTYPRVCLALVILLLIWAAPASAEPPQSSAKPRPASPEKKIIAVRPALRPVTLTGFTRARARMNLICETSGRCLAVTAEVGQAIGADGVFARLDDVFVRLELEANQVKQARLRSRAAYLAKETERTRKLVRKKSQAQSKLDRMEQDLDQARLELKALEVAEKTLKERKARRVVAAPPGWRVITRLLEPGQWAARGSLAGSVGDFKTLLVPLALGPREYKALKQMKNAIRLRAPDLGKQVPAVIERVSPAFDPATRKINLDLAVAGGLAEMRGGLRMEITLKLPDPSGAVLAPADALERRYQETWLTRADGGRVRVVVLGRTPDGLWRVSSPQVKPGQRFLAGPR